MAGLHEKSRTDAVDDDLVIYSTETRIVHAGIACGRGVRSKWGESYIWEHGTFEIPSEYGWEVHYYAAPPAEEMKERFRLHALRQLDAYYAQVDQFLRDNT